MTDSMLSIALALRSWQGPWVMGFRVTGWGVTKVSTMADPDPSRPDLLARAEQTHSRTLREQVAELAEAVAQVELDVARVREDIAEQGRSLAAQAREHAKQAREFAARERAEGSACAWSGG